VDEATDTLKRWPGIYRLSSLQKLEAMIFPGIPHLAPRVRPPT